MTADALALLHSLRWFSVSSPAMKDGNKKWRAVPVSRRAIRSRAGGLDRIRYVAALRELIVAGEVRIEIDEDGESRILVHTPTIVSGLRKKG